MLTGPAEQNSFGRQIEHHFLLPAQAGKGNKHVLEFGIHPFLFNLFLIWVYLLKLRKRKTDQQN